jgi:uncharacterized surface protein with fasciclin (FAS1) repeats
MKYRDRIIRVIAALAVAGIIAVQIPTGGGTAQASLPIPGTPNLPADGYVTKDTDNSGKFLGIKGLTNRNAITGFALGLVGYGLYSTVLETRSVGSTAAAGALGAGAKSGLKGLLMAGDATKPIYDVADGIPTDFSELIKLVKDGNMVMTLRENGPYTFFAPNNLGLGQLAPDQILRLRKPENKASLTRLIQFHTVKGRYKISDLLNMKDGSSLETLAGESVIVTNKDGILKINGVAVVMNDIAASNGWIHAIEGPLPSSE